MTLSLTAAQATVLRDLSLDASEPLAWVEIETGIVISLRIDDTPIPDTTGASLLSVRGAGSAVLPIYWVSVGAAAIADTAMVRITGSEPVEETAELTAAAIRELYGTVNGLAAWSVGSTVYVRFDDALDEILVIDSAIPAGADSVADALVGAWQEQSRPRYAYVSGGEPMEWLPASILEIGAAGQEIDRQTRRVDKQQRELVLRWDRSTEDMIRLCPLQGRTVRVRRGTRRYPIADWVPSGVYCIADGPYPGSLGQDPRDYRDDERPPLQFVLEDRAQYILSAREEAQIQGALTAIPIRHPLEVVREVYRIALTGSPTTASPFVDETSLDPEAAQWASPPSPGEDIRHWTWARNPTSLWAGATMAVETFFRFAPQVTRATIGSLSLRRDGQEADRFGRPPVDEYVVRRGSEPTEATLQEILDEVMLLIPGQIVAEEDGVIRARRIDARTIAAGSATIRDWRHVFEPEKMSDARRSMVNRVLVGLGAGISDGEEARHYRSDYALEDGSSARAHSVRGIPELLRDLRTDVQLSASGVLRGGFPRQAYAPAGITEPSHGWYYEAAAAGDRRITIEQWAYPVTAGSTSIRVGGLQFGGFVGSRAEPTDLLTAPELPPAWARVSSARRAYLRLVSPANMWRVVNSDWLDRPAGTETIECDGATLPPGVFPDNFLDTGTLQSTRQTGRVGLTGARATQAFTLGALDYQISARAVEGTTPSYWLTGCPVQDITMARVLAREYLDPWGWGAPTIEGRTPLGELDVQLGDYVTIPLPHYLDFRAVGGLGLVWQVVAKAEQRGHIDWRLQLAYRPGPPIFARVVPPRIDTVPPPITLTPLDVRIVPARGFALAAGEGVPTLPPLPRPGGTLPLSLIVVIASETGETTGVTWGARSLDLASEAVQSGWRLQVWALQPSEVALASSSVLALTGTANGVTVIARWTTAAEYSGITGVADAADVAVELIAGVARPRGSVDLVAALSSTQGAATTPPPSAYLEDAPVGGAGRVTLLLGRPDLGTLAEWAADSVVLGAAVTLIP